MAVENGEGLERLALLANEQAAVGEHAVNIKDRRLEAQTTALRLQQQFRRELEGRHQMTLTGSCTVLVQQLQVRPAGTAVATIEVNDGKGGLGNPSESR